MLHKKEKDVLKKNKSRLLEIDGVVSVGLCKEKDEPKIKIGVLKDYSKDKLPKDIQGVPIIIEEVEEMDEPLVEADIGTYREKHRPLRPGLQIGIGISARGSMGFSIVHNGELYIITAAHLLRNGWEGRVFHQPNKSYTGEDKEIGEVVKWVDIYDGTSSSSSAAPGDVMAIKADPEISATNEPLELPGVIPEKLIEPELDMEVYHMGRTTGLRKAKITEVDVTSRIRGTGSNPSWYCENLFRTDSESEGGDSGGCVISVDPPGIVGTHVASSSRGTLSSSAIEACEVLGFGRSPKLATGKQEKSGSKYFKDVTEDYDWGGGAVDALDWLYEQGLIAGISEDEFAPDRDITRYEKAQLMKRMIDRLGGK